MELDHTTQTTPQPTVATVATVDTDRSIATVAAPTLPTADDVNSLAIALDRDGFGPHEEAVANLARFARQIGAASASDGVLVDRSAPEVVRMRAFGTIAGRWPRERLNESQTLHEQRERFEASFDELRSAWLDHDRVRRARLGFDELWRSRTALDRIRLEVARRRREAFGEVGPTIAGPGA